MKTATATLHNRELTVTDIEAENARTVICPDCGQMEIWSDEEIADHGLCRSSQDVCPVCHPVTSIGVTIDPESIFAGDDDGAADREATLTAFEEALGVALSEAFDNYDMEVDVHFWSTIENKAEVERELSGEEGWRQFDQDRETVLEVIDQVYKAGEFWRFPEESHA